MAIYFSCAFHASVLKNPVRVSIALILLHDYQHLADMVFFTVCAIFYCVCIESPLVPLKGDETSKTVIADHNRANGKRWKDLSDDQRAVFDPNMFHALAGVPNPLAASDSDEDDESEEGDSFIPVPKVRTLTVEEEQLYRPIYKDLVDIKKVEEELGKPASGPSSASLQRKSSIVIEKVAHDVSFPSVLYSQFVG